MPVATIIIYLYIQFFMLFYLSGVYKEKLIDQCDLQFKNKYKYLKFFPSGSLIPLYCTEKFRGKYISSVIIVPLHFGYVKGDYSNSREEAEESAAKNLLQNF